MSLRYPISVAKVLECEADPDEVPQRPISGGSTPSLQSCVIADSSSESGKKNVGRK